MFLGAMKMRSLVDALYRSRLGVGVFQAFVEALGRHAIERAVPTRDGRFLQVKLRGVARPLYWPSALGLHNLYIVAQEQGYPWHWHYYEIPQTRVSAADVVLDCGAAEGLFSLRVLDRCRSSFLIEPLPLFVEGLKRTFAGARKAHVVQAALSDRKGTARLKEDGIASKIVDGPDGRATRVLTVDGLCRQMRIRPSYIKADLEGSEPAMIRGAKELIRRHKPRIAITTYDDPAFARELKSLLKSYHSDYEFRTKGLMPSNGAPFMLHAW
jgi:FkbM family methyltransferase